MFFFLHSRTFWQWFLTALIIALIIFLWIMGYFRAFLPSLTRPYPEISELIYTVILILLIGLNGGLLGWKSKHGSCPLGAKRATSLAGFLACFSLVCPACLLLPFTIFGLSISLAFLSPFLPLIRFIVIVLLLVSTFTLWPRQKEQ